MSGGGAGGCDGDGIPRCHSPRKVGKGTEAFTAISPLSLSLSFGEDDRDEEERGKIWRT